MTIGVLGAGQLGRMLALAGYPLGLRFKFLDPAPGSPAGQLAPQVGAGYDDAEALRRFAAGVDLVTYEFENVPVEAARWLAEIVPVYPPPAALEASQDRLAEKQLFARLGIPVPAFSAVECCDDLQRSAAQIGLPAVLKTRRFGYDGKGQYVVRAKADLEPAWRELGGRPLILEQHVVFERELSLLAVRSPGGETAFYPLVENHHREGILRHSLAPAPGLSAAMQLLAEEYGRLLLEALDYVGVLALELFQQGDILIANEMAPRVHNSGHWTIEGALTCQFENHLRAIAGWPLGAIAVRGCAAMVNLIGTVPDTSEVLRLVGAHLHLYGKEPRPGRKLGHVTLVADNEYELGARLDALRAVIRWRGRDG